MKVRIRFRSKTVSLAVPEDSDLTQLLLSIAKAPDTSLPDDFRLSLNGKDPLPEGESSLQALGIVGGDLLYVLEETKPRSTPPQQQTQVAQTPSASHECSDTTKSNEIDEYEFSTSVTSSLGRLGDVYKATNASTLGDVISLAIHSFMLDIGFSVAENQMALLPETWKRRKHGWCQFDYFPPPQSTVSDNQTSCTLVCLSLGPSVIIHGCVSCCEGMRRTLKVKPSDYIRGDVSLDAKTDQIYQDLPTLRQRFLTVVGYPLLEDIKREMGFINRASFIGLPCEVKLRVLGHLNHRHLSACTSVCRELNVLGNDQSLWAALFRRYFKNELKGKNATAVMDWKKEFRLCLEKKRSRHGHYPPPRVWPSHWTGVGSPYSTERYSTERYSFMGMRGGEYDRLPYSLASPLRPIHPYSRGGGRVGSLFPPT
ncbi:F-box only protein 7-like [Oscarella lobularis]|uniref:F-box only protein 7-like n=1 Tax=Oscarella lobularis TaxID=121494 RepID=UPI0033134DD7